MSAGSSGVSPVERAASALVGYSFGAVVVLPFDRIKTLMQTQVAVHGGKSNGAVAVARHVVASQGIRGLYQAAQPHMMIAPFTMLYYSVYDEILQHGGGGPLQPLKAAVCARTLETTLRMPLELMRTQMQASQGHVSLSQCFRTLRSQPPRAWYRGWVPTLLRDVPFSAIYWVTYENAKQKVEIPAAWVPSSGLRTLSHGWVCGAFAGMIAALATTPTDVIKTVRQHQMDAGSSPRYGDIIRHLVKTPRRAFAGVGPRLCRIPLGMSTMMSGIEFTRWAFAQRRLEMDYASNACSCMPAVQK